MDEFTVHEVSDEHPDHADGQVEYAYKVLDACVYARRWDSPILKEHRRILKEGMPEPPPKVEPPSGLPDVQKLLLIGGPVAVLILVFGYLQFREIRRRRGASAPTS